MATTASLRQCLQQLGWFLIADPRLQISVRRPAGDQGPAKLSCNSQCHLIGQPVYIWYRNNQEVARGRTLYRHGIRAKDQFSCGMSGFRVPSPAVCESRSSCSLNCYSQQVCFTVSVKRENQIHLQLLRLNGKKTICDVLLTVVDLIKILIWDVIDSLFDLLKCLLCRAILGLLDNDQLIYDVIFPPWPTTWNNWHDIQNLWK